MAEWKGLDKLDALKAKFEALPTTLGTELHKRIVDKTPRVSGRAADGWQLVIDKTSIVIGNNVPYIRVLEFGDEHRAPHGMVGTTIMEAPEIIKGLIGDK